MTNNVNANASVIRKPSTTMPIRNSYSNRGFERAGARPEAGGFANEDSDIIIEEASFDDINNFGQKKKKVQTKYAIRFHFKSGKERDMHIDEEDADGNPNELMHVKSIFHSVQRTLDTYNNYSSKNECITSQNFMTYKDSIEFMELVERD